MRMQLNAAMIRYIVWSSNMINRGKVNSYGKYSVAVSNIGKVEHMNYHIVTSAKYSESVKN